MKGKKAILLAVASMILVVFFVSRSAPASEKLEIHIRSDKNQFFVHEPILVYYQVQNVSDSIVFLSFGMIQEDFIIKDEQGRRYATQFRGSWMPMDSLRPGEMHSSAVNVYECYGVQDIGEYTCYVYSQPSAVLHFPTIESNTIKFRLLEPKGEEKEALDLYLEAESLKWTKDKDPEKRAHSFLRFQELVDRYPNSVYAPSALSSAWGIYRYSQKLEDRKKNIPVYNRLIENYPDSHYAPSAFCGLVETYEKLKDKSGAIRAMKELMEKHPDTNISARAEYWLEKIEEWEFE